MRQRRALHGLVPRMLLALGLVLLVTGAASAWQATSATSTAGTTGETAAQVGGNASETKTDPPPCPPAGLAQVQVCEVWLVPPFDRENETESEAANASGVVSQRCPSPQEGASEEDLPVVELRDTIAVRVRGLKSLLDQKSCLAANGERRDIILYLNRRPLPKLVAAPPSDPARETLMFPLARTEDSRDVWTYLLGRPNPLKDRKVEVSVGIDNAFAVPSSAYVSLRVMPTLWFSFWVLLFAALVVGFFLLARRSDVLRDPVSAPTGARPPYSLSRTQGAVWFFLILASYLLIGMVTGDFSTSITGTTLALLGVSAGTAVGSAFVDANKTSLASDAQDAARATALQAELATLDQEIATLTDSVRKSGNPLEAHELAAKEAMRTEQWSMYRKLTHQSQSFLLDILSDSGGVNFHRFQMMAWTIVLGFIFAGHVYRDLAMPQFSETLLALMGISAGTYLGLKIPENPSPNPTPPNPASPNPTPPNPAPPNPAPPNPAPPNPAP